MILALDASTDSGTAAVVERGRLVRELVFPGGRARGGGAASALAEVAGNLDIKAVVVGTGPGSYSGVRAAVAAAWGFAAARHIPLRGVSSLLALGPGEYLAVGDARRGEFYFAWVRDGEFIEAPRLAGKEAIASLLEKRPELPVFSPAGMNEIFPRAVPRTPQAALLAGFAMAGDAAGGLPTMPEPLYLKPPHATLPSGHA
ncbi:MAG: tRNA (adenosine(37)-N6)-threonylcarbamoyltransferase complex dimerization subunit type 1 TsaB [Terrimicrobiaceae bacterium]|nr:tRNA (adenosine(37)-N6)-threonylcarbamoyltransferase complex dimerization subunit type 1 TsaB [Terrimicrobiaceae bacterium]